MTEQSLTLLELFRKVTVNLQLLIDTVDPDLGYYIDVLRAGYNRTQVDLVLNVCREVLNSQKSFELKDPDDWLITLATTRVLQEAKLRKEKELFPDSIPQSGRISCGSADSTISYKIRSIVTRIDEIDAEINLLLEKSLSDFSNKSLSLDPFLIKNKLSGNVADALSGTYIADLFRRLVENSKYIVGEANKDGSTLLQEDILQWVASELTTTNTIQKQALLFLYDAGLIKDSHYWISDTNKLVERIDVTGSKTATESLLGGVGWIAVDLYEPTLIGKEVLASWDDSVEDSCASYSKWDHYHSSFNSVDQLYEHWSISSPVSLKLLGYLAKYDVAQPPGSLTEKELEFVLSGVGRETLRSEGLIMSNPFAELHSNESDIILSPRGRFVSLQILRIIENSKQDSEIETIDDSDFTHDMNVVSDAEVEPPTNPRVVKKKKNK